MRIRESLSAIAVVLLAAPAGAAAQGMDEHEIVSPDAIEWASGPPSIPPGAEAAVLYGDPSKEELFALRLKLPEGYHIAPHTHPKPEVVTIISGEASLGMGETADRDEAEALPAGSFFAMAPGMAHYIYADEETVLQLNSTGPWSLTYIDPEDDPRETQ